MTDTHYIIARLQGQSAVVGSEERHICEEAVRRLAVKYPKTEFFVTDETGEPVYRSKVIRINLLYVGLGLLALGLLIWNL